MRSRCLSPEATIEGKLLSRSDIEKLWLIDRSELIEAAYSVVDGALVRRSVHYDMKGWPPGEAEKYTPILEACHDRGGWFHGLFDGQKPIGAAVLEAQFIGKGNDRLQLKFLHVSSDYRGRGLGKQLFLLAAGEAHRRGARALYISATPSQHTIDFYLRLGCRLAAEPDPELFELEPEDLHLEYDLGLGGGPREVNG